MAVKGITALTLADWGKRIDPNGKIDKIIELLSQTNPILQDMLIVEGNLPTGHRTTIRSGLPSATWRLLNYGVQPSKSTTVQVTDGIGMLETYAEIDKSLADLNGNTAEFRLSEDRAFIEAMNQQMAQTLFYGDTALTRNSSWACPLGTPTWRLPTRKTLSTPAVLAPITLQSGSLYGAKTPFTVSSRKARKQVCRWKIKASRL